METAFLSGISRTRYRVLLKEFHNALCMGHNKYPKMLTSAYNLAINWKGGGKGLSVTPNDGVAFTIDSKEANLQVTDGMKMTWSGNPFICHICGKNNYAERCPYREENALKNKSKKVKDTPEKKITPTKVSVNETIGEDWGGGTNYGGLMFCQFTVDTATNKDHNI